MGTLLAILLASAARADVPDPGPAVEAPDPVAVAFSAKLNFQGPPEQKALFEALVRRITASPTTKALAVEFSAGQGAVSTRFSDMPGTAIYERREGRSTFAGNHAAHVVRGESEARIELNRACLEIDPEYAVEQCASELAHESLGHTLGWLDAGPAGVRAAYVQFDDEFWARMTQWALWAESGSRVNDPEAWCALNDPEGFQKKLSMTYPSSMEAVSHRQEALEVAKSPAGKRVNERMAALREKLLAMPDSFFAVDDCSDYLAR